MTQPADTCEEREGAPGRYGDIADRLNAHTYPRLLHTSRAAYRLFQASVHLTTLRSWYVRRAIRRVMRRLQTASPVVLDVGCGSGDHLQYACRRIDGARGIGVDRAADAVALCRAHADRSLEFHQVDLGAGAKLPRADVILCITVLQYIRDDGLLLARMRSALREGGVLLLYVPVRNERLLPLYDRIVKGSASDYDAAQDHQRVYRPSEVESLLSETGFTIASIENAYGACGKLAFELHSILLHGLTQPRTIFRIASAIGAAALSPAIVALMLLDYHVTSNRGNALVIEAH